MVTLLQYSQFVKPLVSAPPNTLPMSRVTKVSLFKWSRLESRLAPETKFFFMETSFKHILPAETRAVKRWKDRRAHLHTSGKDNPSWAEGTAPRPPSTS